MNDQYLTELVSTMLYGRTSSFNTENVKKGDTVRIKSSFGGGPLVTGVVTAVEEDIKKGFPGIDYVLSDYALDDPAGGRWAYMDQVTEIISKAE